jgi:hypothetical protein
MARVDAEQFHRRAQPMVVRLRREQPGRRLGKRSQGKHERDDRKSERNFDQRPVGATQVEEQRALQHVQDDVDSEQDKDPCWFGAFIFCCERNQPSQES